MSGYERERFTINMALRIWDEALSLNDTAYVTKLVEHPEAPDKDGVTISNNLSAIGGLSLDGVIARITGIAEAVNQKKALYDRSRAISQDGSIPAKRLEGMIDVLRTRLSSSVSNWYTDENGNLVLEAVNGLSAMQLCGDGFMIANRKTDDGKWDWRTFGTGEGFSADMLVTGFLSADRIDAHSITANKLASDVGQSLDLSSNTTINLRVEKPTVGGTNLIPNTSDQYVEVTLGQYYTPVSERIELAALSLSPGDTITCSMYLKTAPEKAACARVTTYYAESGDDGKTIFAAKEPISAESEGKS